MPEVEESVVIGQEWEEDIRIILFVKLANNYTLTNDLQQKIKEEIKKKCVLQTCSQKNSCCN